MVDEPDNQESKHSKQMDKPDQLFRGICTIFSGILIQAVSDCSKENVCIDVRHCANLG